jgi:hypothetical protein
VTPLLGASFVEPEEVETAMEADEALTFDPSEVGPDASGHANDTVNYFACSHEIDFDVGSIGLFCSRVARFFLVQIYQNWKNIPNEHKLYETAINYTKWQ